MKLGQGAMLLAIAATALGACAGTGTPSATGAITAAIPSPATTTVPTSPPASPTAPAEVARVLDFGEPIWGIASAGGTIWVEGDSGLYQVDGGTGERLRSIQGIAPTVADGSLWFIRGDEVIRADPDTGADLASYKPPHLGTAVHDGTLWSADETAGTLYAIDLESGKVRHQLKLPAGEPKWVQFWEGAVWVVIDGADVVLRIDPATATVDDTIPGGSRPHSVATGFGSLWVIDHGASDVVRLGPDGSVQATVHGPGLNVAIATTTTQVWAASATGVMAIDPATNAVTREVELGGGEWYGMAVSQGSLWVTTAEGGKLYQLNVE